MGERKRLEIKHDEDRMVGCDLCDAVKLGAHIYRSQHILPHFFCGDCVKEISEDWLKRETGGAGE